MAARAELWERATLAEPRVRRAERWPRFQAEIPPELAEQLDAAGKRQLGVNVSAFTRGGVVRAALRDYLERLDPEPPAAIDGTAVEVHERLELTA